MQWYYKDGKGKLFEEGEDPIGWTDKPNKVYVPKEEKPAPKKKKKAK